MRIVTHWHTKFHMLEGRLFTVTVQWVPRSADVSSAICEGCSVPLADRMSAACSRQHVDASYGCADDRRQRAIASAEFIGISPAFHHAVMKRCQRAPAMKQNTTTAKNENIVIPIKIERVKLWTRWTLEATTWLISLGLLAASVAVAGGAALVWMISGSETILALGFAGGLLLGLAGVWHLLHRLDRVVNELKHESPGAA